MEGFVRQQQPVVGTAGRPQGQALRILQRRPLQRPRQLRGLRVRVREARC